MKTRSMQLALALIALLTSGCLTTRAQLRGQGNTPSDSNPNVVTPEVRKANEMARLDEHDDQMRQLNGRVDVIENHLSQINAGQQDRVDQDRRAQEQLDLRLKAYEEELKKLGQQMALLAEDLRALRARNEKPLANAKADAFQEGESAFSQKDWQQAVVAYDNYRKAHPKGKKYSTATLKIGMAFQEMKFKDEAKAFYEEVIAKFPKSKDAKSAEKRLKTLK